MRYYTIIVQWEQNEAWMPQYGSFNRQDCVDEFLDDSYADAFQVRIIATAPEQSAIEAAIAKLNQ